MTPEELDQALRQKPRPQPAPLLPASVQPLSQAIGCSDQDALRMARAKNLLGEDGQLYCWSCSGPCPWHVSLHCDPCRERSIYFAPERRRAERQAELDRIESARRNAPPEKQNVRAFR